MFDLGFFKKFRRLSNICVGDGADITRSCSALRRAWFGFPRHRLIRLMERIGGPALAVHWECRSAGHRQEVQHPAGLRK